MDCATVDAIRAAMKLIVSC